MNSGSKTKNNVTYLRKRQPAILVVEHEILTRISIAESLRNWGFKVCEAGNGDEAVTLLTSGTIDVGFAIVDLDMPPAAMDGAKFVAWLHDTSPQTIALVASADKRKLALADKFGARFIAKPYDPRNVLIVIRGTTPRRR